MTMAMVCHIDNQALGIGSKCKYCSSDNLVINLDLWRSDRVCRKAIRYIVGETRFYGGAGDTC